MFDDKLYDYALLGDGQHSGLMCPECESPERSLTFKKENGTIKWHCFRASCGYSGTRFVSNHFDTEVYTHTPEIRPYTGRMMPLYGESTWFFKERYNICYTGFFEDCTAGDKTGRYILPIYDPTGTVRGYTSRRPWDGAPIQDKTDRPKSLTYWHTAGPLISWYGEKGVSRAILVEDQLSAVRFIMNRDDTDNAAVALLGTGINEAKIAEIQRQVDHVTIALDADATGQAFAMARKWGQAFKSCRVLVLEQDIKDMPLEQLRNIEV